MTINYIEQLRKSLKSKLTLFYFFMSMRLLNSTNILSFSNEVGKKSCNRSTTVKELPGYRMHDMDSLFEVTSLETLNRTLKYIKMIIPNNLSFLNSYL